MPHVKPPQTSTSRIELEPHQVLLRPLLSEKGTHRADRNQLYSFEVNPLATKRDIRRAVQDLFHVKVLWVNTQTRKGKPRRTKFRQSHTKNWKKAVVKLHSDDRIAFY